MRAEAFPRSGTGGGGGGVADDMDGTDTVIFDGKEEEYSTIEYKAGKWKIKHEDTGEVDRLIEIEMVSFVGGGDLDLVSV